LAENEAYADLPNQPTRKDLNPDESYLLTRIAAGDQQAFTLLYGEYQPLIARYILLFTRTPVVAEELVQDVFFRLWDHRGHLPEVPLLKAYILKIARNLVIDYLRREQVKFRVLVELRNKGQVGYQHVEESLAHRQYEQLTQQAVSLLPPGRKKIFQLSVEKGLTHDEIAATLQISKSVVKKQLYAAFDAVRAYLTEHGELEFGLLLLSASSLVIT
jgi:RNA polymerase sigma-70 factor (ECF subfamily)